MTHVTLHKALEGHSNDVRSVAFSPDSKIIASASFRTVRFWNLPNGDLNAELKGHEHLVYSVAFSPDGKSIVTASADKTVRTWSVATKQQIKILNGHSDYVRSVAWSPNSDLIASCSDDKTVILWDATSGSAKKKLAGHNHYVYSVSFSQNGNKLASAGWDKTVIIWDVDSGAALITLAHSSIILSVCFSLDDQFVVTGGEDKIVRMFHAYTGHEEKRFEGHTNDVYSVAMSFDGSIIASVSEDKSMRLWDVVSTKQLQQLDGHTFEVYSVAFSRDGKFIASGSKDNTVRLWNAPSSLQRQILPEPVAPRFCASLYDFASSEKGALSFQQSSILSIDGRDENGWAQATLFPSGASGLIPLNYVEIISEAEAQRRLQQQKQQKAAAELEKKEKELLAKQQEIEKQQKEIERQKAEQQKREQEIADRERRQREQKKQEEAKTSKANLDPRQVAEWSVDDVCRYLKQAKISDDVVEIFRQERIRGGLLASKAKDEVLKSMGVKAMGDREDVIAAISMCFNSSSPATPASTTGGCDVFVSYRRSGGSSLAYIITQTLRQKGFNVFYDIGSLSIGDFEQAIGNALKSANCVVVVLSPGALDRCLIKNDPEGKDWIRKEIAMALKEGKHLLPVLDPDFTFPDLQELPEDMRRVTLYHGIKWYAEYPEAALEKLEKFIRDSTLKH